MKNAVTGIVIEEGKFFIARRKLVGDLGGKWEFPGGKVEAGENDEQALIREYREELGVTVHVGMYLGYAEFEHRGTPYVAHAYQVYFLDHNFTLVEHTEWQWAHFEEIAHLDFVDSDAKLLPFLKMIPD
jgi:8-oxo-dGTP diphosphatase